LKVDKPRYQPVALVIDLPVIIKRKIITEFSINDADGSIVNNGFTVKDSGVDDFDGHFI